MRRRWSTGMVAFAILLGASAATAMAQTLTLPPPNPSSSTGGSSAPSSTPPNFANEVSTVIVTGGTLAKVQAAVSQGKAAVVALVRSSRQDPEVAQALLRQATRTQTGASLDGGAMVAAIRSSHPGCRSGNYHTRSTITAFGVTLAWEEVIQHGFCWNGSAITWSGGSSVRRYTAAPYCWNDTSEGDVWYVHPKWKDAYAYGVVGGNAVFGCVSLQSLAVNLYYANGGGIFYHES